MEITDPKYYRYYRSIVTEFFRVAEDVIRQRADGKTDKEIESHLGCSAITAKRVKSGRQIESVKVALSVMDKNVGVREGTWDS